MWALSCHWVMLCPSWGGVWPREKSGLVGGGGVRTSGGVWWVLYDDSNMHTTTQKTKIGGWGQKTDLRETFRRTDMQKQRVIGRETKITHSMRISAL